MHPLTVAYVRRLLICSSAIFGISAAPVASAQSVRRSPASGFPAFTISVAASRSMSRCTEAFDYSTIRDTTSSVTPPESIVTADSFDTADDTMDAALTLPGSGMVLVDPHGRIIAPLSAGRPVARAAAVDMPATCCATNEAWSGVLLDIHAAKAQTVSSGSSVRARCADAMNPPPSRRSPL